VWVSYKTSPLPCFVRGFPRLKSDLFTIKTIEMAIPKEKILSTVKAQADSQGANGIFNYTVSLTGIAEVISGRDDAGIYLNDKGNVLIIPRDEGADAIIVVSSKIKGDYKNKDTWSFKKSAAAIQKGGGLSKLMVGERELEGNKVLFAYFPGTQSEKDDFHDLRSETFGVNTKESIKEENKVSE
jgi:hypothetical protein